MTKSEALQQEQDSKKLDARKQILFSFLSLSNSASLEEIATQTGIPNEAVSNILSRLENKNKIKQANGIFSLTPKTEHLVSIQESGNFQFVRNISHTKKRTIFI